jgi:hypothetical protein
MPQHPIQFQPVMHLFEFVTCYGTETLCDMTLDDTNDARSTIDLGE